MIKYGDIYNFPMNAFENVVNEEELTESENELETTSIKENGNIQFEKETDNQTVYIKHDFINLFLKSN